MNFGADRAAGVLAGYRLPQDRSAQAGYPGFALKSLSAWGMAGQRPGAASRRLPELLGRDRPNDSSAPQRRAFVRGKATIASDGCGRSVRCRRTVTEAVGRTLRSSGAEADRSVRLERAALRLA